MKRDKRIHKDICIPFTLAGRKFEAVGFLRANEREVKGKTMLARTDNHNTVVDKKDYCFIRAHHHELPSKLREYYLFTKVKGRGSARHVQFFFYYCLNWFTAPENLNGTWDKSDLVLRRRN